MSNCQDPNPITVYSINQPEWKLAQRDSTTFVIEALAYVRCGAEQCGNASDLLNQCSAKTRPARLTNLHRHG
jgi:hypothetical protein